MNKSILIAEKPGAYYRTIFCDMSSVTQRFGQSFGPVNLSQIKNFFLLWSAERIFRYLLKNWNVEKIRQTASGELKNSASSVIPQTPSAESSLASIASCFPFPWVARMQFVLKDNDNKFTGNRRRR